MVFFMTTMTPTSLPTCFCPIFGTFFAPFFLRPFSFSLSWYDNPCSPFPTNFLPFLGLLCLCFGSQPTLHRVSTHNALFLAFDRYKDHPDLLGRNRPKFCVFCKRYTDLKKSTLSPVVAVVTNISYRCVRLVVNGRAGVSWHCSLFLHLHCFGSECFTITMNAFPKLQGLFYLGPSSLPRCILLTKENPHCKCLSQIILAHVSTRKCLLHLSHNL